jgi:ATP-dependent Clp protease ATP-binding subunit ClpX
MCRPAITSSGENVSVHIQGEILAMIEGTSVEVSLAGEDVIGLTELVDTKNILFICAGAFAGIEDIVKKEKNKSASIGINAELKSNDYQMNAKDISKETIIKFGVTPELAGRLTITTVLNKLTKDDMYKILTQCEDNVIDELKTIAETGYGCEIDIKEEAIMSLINRLCMDVGARGLRSIVFEYFNDILFDVSKEKNVKKIIVDKDLQSRLEYKKTRMKKVQGK